MFLNTVQPAEILELAGGAMLRARIYAGLKRARPILLIYIRIL